MILGKFCLFKGRAQLSCQALPVFLLLISQSLKLTVLDRNDTLETADSIAQLFFLGLELIDRLKAGLTLRGQFMDQKLILLFEELVVFLKLEAFADLFLQGAFILSISLL
jgi:hypothetical protein